MLPTNINIMKNKISSNVSPCIITSKMVKYAISICVIVSFEDFSFIHIKINKTMNKIKPTNPPVNIVFKYQL